MKTKHEGWSGHQAMPATVGEPDEMHCECCTPNAVM